MDGRIYKHGIKAGLPDSGRPPTLAVIFLHADDSNELIGDEFIPGQRGWWGGLPDHARAFCQRFFAWYNHDHRHSGIGYMTAAIVHTGRAQQLYEVRQRVLDQAFVAHPERFTQRHPTPPDLPTQVGINLPQPTPRAPGKPRH